MISFKMIMAKHSLCSIVNHRNLSTTKKFQKVGVVGLGLMGHGVAQIVAQAGYQVVAIETNQEALNAGMKRIEGSMNKIVAKDVQKGKINEADGKKVITDVMSKFQMTTNTKDAKDCDLIIEAIAENLDLKLKFYQDLGSFMKPEAVFASNTSSLPITSMGVASGRPKQFLGLHFFNPVQIMKLVEVVRTDQTAPEIFDSVVEFAKSIGKTTVNCKDTPGFIVNRLLVPYIAQSLAMLDRGDASFKDIDVSMQLGAGHPMGPFQLADYIGLDTCRNILAGWIKSHPEEPAFFMPKCLEELVQQGKLGRKSGQGFYTWEGDKIKA